MFKLYPSERLLLMVEEPNTNFWQSLGVVGDPPGLLRSERQPAGV